jgi:hypothetical protein
MQPCSAAHRLNVTVLAGPHPSEALKPTLILDALRDAEAPLFHVTANSIGIFRNWDAAPFPSLPPASPLC